MIQIRPAFGGNIMAQIAITKSRPQFSTVRYRVMDRAVKVEHPTGEVVICHVGEEMLHSKIQGAFLRSAGKVKRVWKRKT